MKVLAEVEKAPTQASMKATAGALPPTLPQTQRPQGTTPQPQWGKVICCLEPFRNPWSSPYPRPPTQKVRRSPLRADSQLSSARTPCTASTASGACTAPRQRAPDTLIAGS